MSTAMYKEVGTARFMPQLGKADAVCQVNVITSLVTGVLMTVVALAAAKLSFALFAAIWIIAGVMAAYFRVARDPGTLFGLDENKAAFQDTYARFGDAR